MNQNKHAQYSNYAIGVLLFHLFQSTKTTSSCIAKHVYVLMTLLCEVMNLGVGRIANCLSDFLARSMCQFLCR
jgi:hypothetical protein